MLVVGLISFSLFRFVGRPVSTMMGQEASVADREALRERLGLNDPFVFQFAASSAARQGDFGISYRLQQPVMELILSRLPATLELALISGIIAFLLGVSLGVYTALNRRGWLSNTIMTVSLIGVSLPTFLIGMLLIWVFAVELQWLPSFGRGDVVGVGDWWRTGLLTESGRASLVLPAITLGLYQMTLIMRLVRAEMLEVLRTDYIKFARARGLSNRAVHFGHALKNTMVPVITITGLQLGSHHRLRHHHRDRVPVAGRGRAVHPVGAVRRRAGDGGLPDADRADLRGDQPDRRPALLRRRPPPAGGPREREALR
jgi:peptide/nickel transport system permease protein